MSKGRRVLSVLLILAIPIWAAVHGSPAHPQPLTIKGAVTYVYKSIDGTELRLHLFKPPNHASSMRRPAILFFFGGGWRSGSVEQFVPQSKYFAARGMVAIVADYRVLTRHKTGPFEAMADAKSAIRWVRSRVTELGIDPNRIAASGGSAGGHLALSAAVFDRFDEPSEYHNISSKPDALVLFNPGVDTTAARAFGARGTEGSPLHHIVGGLPPMIILHGKMDETVPYASVKAFCQKARELGNRCDLRGYDNAMHGFFNPNIAGGKWYHETLLDADRFLTELGYLPEPIPAPVVELSALSPGNSRSPLHT